MNNFINISASNTKQEKKEYQYTKRVIHTQNKKNNKQCNFIITKET